MTLKVIGSGFGRTGTLSLKAALEILGFGPCYHMEEVIKRPFHTKLWQQIGRGKAVPWEQIFHNFDLPNPLLIRYIQSYHKAVKAHLGDCGTLVARWIGNIVN